MSNPSRHDDCGCCGGIRDQVPVRLYNRPGLDQISYRSGTYGTFRQSMLARLASAPLPSGANLRSGASDDFTVALIDAWAVAGDVLTFYIERTAQEHYLATATERRSIDDLVRLIGYQLMSGIAATTWLAFTLETSPDPENGFRPAPVPGVPERVTIPAGLRVQSVPNPGELPQTFETVEEVEALADWNNLQARLTKIRYPQNGDTSVLLAGVGLGLSTGDLLLFVAGDWSPANPGDRWDMHRVTNVDPDPGAQRTRVHWADSIKNIAIDEDETVSVRVFVMRQQASLFGYNAPDPRLFSDEVYDRLRANGKLAPMDPDATGEERDRDWLFDEIDTVNEVTGVIHLHTAVRGLEPGGWAVLTNGDEEKLASISAVAEQTRSGYGVSAAVSALTVNLGEDIDSAFDGPKLRTTSVLVDSEPLVLSEVPDPVPVSGTSISLVHDLGGIDGPRAILIRGRRPLATIAGDETLTVTADDGTQRDIAAGGRLEILALETNPEGSPGDHRWRVQTSDRFVGSMQGAPENLEYGPVDPASPVIGEVAAVVAVTPAGGLVTLRLEQPLVNAYDRASVEIFGNVARSTHGETTLREVIGSGDGAKAFQSFALRKTPLTYIRGSTPGTISSTLEVWVNDVLWREVPTLFGQKSRDRVYVTHMADDGTTVITFGDGENGARLPTGRDNIVARYRTGSGLEGELDAAQLSLLIDRPLGLRSATNPLVPAGAAPPQAPNDARKNAPRTVLTLGRIVSLQDFEDFAGTYPGVGKAAAVWTWDGVRRGILLTVAGTDGEPVQDGDLLHDALVGEISRSGSRGVTFVIKGYRPASFRIAGTVRVSPDREPDNVLESVRTTLAERFSFAARGFGLMVALSEVYAAIHAVPGVVSADINWLYRGTTPRLDTVLVADAPSNGDPPGREGAELLLLDPASLDDLEVVS